MTIDKSGAYWVGTEAADIDEYLRALTAEGYPADRFVHSECRCGNDRFRLHVDADEGAARRTCALCRFQHSSAIAKRRGMPEHPRRLCARAA